jgi:hypothetical protein
MWWPAWRSMSIASLRSVAGARTRSPSKVEATQTGSSPGRQRRHDGAQHPGRLGIVRLVTIPQRGPCVVRCVVAPYRRTSVRTEYERKQFGFSGDLESVGRALEGEPALEHPQLLRSVNGHRLMVPCFQPAQLAHYSPGADTPTPGS